MAFQIQKQNGVVFLTSSLLPVPHAFSTRLGGVSPAPWDSLNLRPGMGDGGDALRENYRRFCGCAGVSMDRLVLSRQVHETTVRPCTAGDAGKGLDRQRDYTADSLITDEKDLPLAVFSADCGVILLHDPVSGAVGGVHAGWRGCAGGILERAVQAMGRNYGAKPENLLAAIGPCIGQCCFETDGDVPDAMRSALGADAEPFLERRGSKYHIDLAGLNRQWLLRSGMLPERIDVCGLCTACRPDLFWSHRKMGDARGVQAAVISAK